MGWIGMDLDVYAGRAAAGRDTQGDHLVWVQATGSGTWRDDGDASSPVRSVKPGDVSVRSAGRSREWRATTDGVTLSLSVQPAFLDRILARAAGSREAHVELEDASCSDLRLAALATLLWDEARQRGIGARIYAEAAITQLGVHLIRCYSRHLSEAPAGASMSGHKLRRVTTFVEQNLAEDLSVQSLAAIAGMSEFHFAHAFRACTGISPHRYVLRCRIEKAKSLLSDTDLSLTEIAHRVGFAHPSHFTVAFHRATDLTPSTFRKLR